MGRGDEWWLKRNEAGGWWSEAREIVEEKSVIGGVDSVAALLGADLVGAKPSRCFSAAGLLALGGSRAARSPGLRRLGRR